MYISNMNLLWVLKSYNMPSPIPIYLTHVHLILLQKQTLTDKTMRALFKVEPLAVCIWNEAID